MLYLILAFSIIYKLIIEERNYVFLASNLFSAIIIQLLRNEISNSIDNSYENLNQRRISNSDKIELTSFDVKTKVVEKHISNNESSEKEALGKEEITDITYSIIKDSIPTTIETIQYCALNDVIQSKVKGSVVNVSLNNKDSISGELILNFQEFIALKSGNTTVWVNPESVDAVS